MRKLGEAWEVEDLNNKEAYRTGMTGNGLKVLVPSVVAEYLPAEGPILELGCGLGALYSLLADSDRRRLSMLDENAEALEILKSKHAGAEVICGSAYQLPFENGVFAAVVGLNFLDFMLDLDTVLQEIRRVLPVNGRLLHIMELAPYLRNILCDIRDDEWAFPLLENTRVMGVKLIKKKDILALPALAESNIIGVLGMLHEDIEASLVLLEQHRTPLFAQLVKIANRIDGRTILLKDSFVHRIGSRLPANGFTTIFNGGRDVYTNPPPDVARVLSPGETWHYDMGYSQPLNLLVAGSTRMKYTFHVTVAEKN